MSKERITEYVLKHFPKRFKNKEIIIKERSTHYEVNHHKDTSPIILSKDI